MTEQEKKNWYSSLGKKGGSVKHPNKGFGSNKNKASQAGKKGMQNRYGKQRGV